MNSINYEKWFALDHWTFFEASCLFNGIDPTAITSDIGNRVDDLLHTLNIFLRADWSDLDPNAVLNNLCLIKHFFEIAKRKKVTLPPILRQMFRDYSEREEARIQLAKLGQAVDFVTIEKNKRQRELSPVAPSDFLKWAASLKIHIPGELAYIVQKQQEMDSRVNTSGNNEDTDNSIAPLLAVFRSMENLYAREIQINLKADSLRVGVLARGKKYEVSMRDFKLINGRRDRLLKTGKAFIAIARDEYDYDPSDRTHSKMANGIKKALGLIDNPFKNGKPKFKFRVSEDETAKYAAQKTAGYLSDTDTAGNLSDTDEDYEPSNNASNEFSPHENSG